MSEARPAMVAVDLGAGSCRVSLLSWDRPRPTVAVVHRFANAPVERGGSLRWDIESIYAGVEDGLRRCAEIASGPIASIGVDGWAVDYVRDAGMSQRWPFCYRDPRNEAAETAVHERIPERRLYEITGLQRLRFNTVYQLYADAMAGISADVPWTNLPEHVLHRLGGRRIAEYTNATHTGLVDLRNRTWSAEIFETLSLHLSAAPEIVPPGTDVGKLGGELAELPAFQNTRLIAPACHDTASAIAAVASDDNDWAYISSGTWSLIGTVLDRPCNSEMAYRNSFTNLGAAGDRICFHKSVNGMWLVQQCIEHWNCAGLDVSLPELIDQAGKLPTPDFWLDVDDPDLMLPGNMPARINGQRIRCGAKPFPANVAPLFANLIFHSLARRYAEVIDELQKSTGRRFRKLCVVGGGSRNQMLNELTARASGLTVAVGPMESSTIGNFAIQMAAYGGACPSRQQISRSAAELRGALAGAEA